MYNHVDDEDGGMCAMRDVWIEELALARENTLTALQMKFTADEQRVVNEAPEKILSLIKSDKGALIFGQMDYEVFSHGGPEVALAMAVFIKQNLRNHSKGLVVEIKEGQSRECISYFSWFLVVRGWVK